MVLHCTVTIEPFVMKKYFLGMYSESTHISCYPSNLNTTVLISINDSCLNLIITTAGKW